MNLIDWSESTELTPQVSLLSTELTQNITALPSELNTLSSELDSLPLELKKALTSLGSRSSPDNIKNLILSLCTFKPFKLPELAGLLKRHDVYVRQNYLMPLIKAGKLEYLFPHQPNHPQQAYKTKRNPHTNR